MHEKRPIPWARENARLSLLIPARHGLGDIIRMYFLGPGADYPDILSRINHLVLQGRKVDVLALYENFMNPAIRDVFENLPFPVTVHDTKSFPGVPERAADNDFPSVVGGHVNVLKRYVPELAASEPEQTVEFPTAKPSVHVPEDFVLFMGDAGKTSCVLKDQAIAETIRSATGLPLVKVGARLSRPGVHCDITADTDLTDRLSIAESMYLARASRLIVSSVSFLRACATLYDKDVVELMEDGSGIHEPLGDTTVFRATEREYRAKAFGIRSERSRWYLWPSQKESLRNHLRGLAAPRR